MFILDDSGSMDWQYIPDYVNDSGSLGDKNCFDGSDSGSNLDQCDYGDPPYMAPEFNKVFYNPDIRYTPAVDYLGNPYPQMDATKTVNFTKVPTDGFNKQNKNLINGGETQTNLTNGVRETVWCNVSAPTAAQLSNTAVCKPNAGGSDGSFAYGYPAPAGGDGFIYPGQYKYGYPFYYRLRTTEYCSDSDLKNCVTASAPTTIGATVYSFPAALRFCKTTSTGTDIDPTSQIDINDCQGQRSPATKYVYPRFLGTIIPVVNSKQAYGIVNIPTAVGVGQSIRSVLVNGVEIITGGVVAGTTAGTDLANALVSAINSANTNPEYRACIGTFNTATTNSCSSGTPNTRVNIFPQTASGGTTALQGGGPNGYVINRNTALDDPTVAAKKATGTLTLSATASAAPARITSVKVGGVEALASQADAPNGLDTPAKRSSFATAIAGKITSNSFTATAVGDVVTIYAAVAGTSENGKTIVVTGSLSSSAKLTIGDNNAGDTSATISNVIVGSTTLTSGPVSSVGGVNTATERDTLASSLASNINTRISSPDYTASASGSEVTLYSPIGTTSSATATTALLPAVVAATGAKTANVAVTESGTGTWTITAVAIKSGGSCPYSDTNALTGSTTASSTNTSIVTYVQTDFSGGGTAGNKRDDPADNILISAPTTASLLFTGTGAWLGTTLNGCTVRRNCDAKWHRIPYDWRRKPHKLRHVYNGRKLLRRHQRHDGFCD